MIIPLYNTYILYVFEIRYVELKIKVAFCIFGLQTCWFLH